MRRKDIFNLLDPLISKARDQVATLSNKTHPESMPTAQVLDGWQSWLADLQQVRQACVYVEAKVYPTPEARSEMALKAHGAVRRKFAAYMAIIQEQQEAIEAAKEAARYTPDDEMLDALAPVEEEGAKPQPRKRGRPPKNVAVGARKANATPTATTPGSKGLPRLGTAGGDGG